MFVAAIGTAIRMATSRIRAVRELQSSVYRVFILIPRLDRIWTEEDRGSSFITVLFAVIVLCYFLLWSKPLTPCVSLALSTCDRT
jgi:hypothetical protein